MERNEHELIREAVSKILNVDTVVKRKVRSKAQKKKEVFVKAIDSIVEAMKKSGELFAKTGMDFSSYDENFLSIIDMLLFMHFDEKCFELISWYLYERMDSEDESDATLLGDDGEEITIKNAYDLYDLIIKIDPSIQK